jgi:hypothetical protein
MGEIADYKTVCVEGGDQVGKADAVLNFSSKVLEQGTSVTYISFPVYASPFGGSIRMFLRNGLESMDMDPYEELSTKMAMYALDRLQIFDVLLSEKKYRDSLIIMDRSPFSNAVTIGYGIANIQDIAEGDVQDFVQYALALEGDMIKKFSFDECVLHLISTSSVWGNVRGERRDINENSDVQLATEKAYNLYGEIIGDGWTQLITKTESGWREREEIYSDILKFTNERVGDFPITPNPGFFTLNIREILGMYEGAEVEDLLVEKYLDALMNNEKEDMHDYGIEVCLALGKTFSNIRFRNSEVLKAFKKVLKMAPKTLDIMDMYVDPNFSSKVIKSVFNE